MGYRRTSVLQNGLAAVKGFSHHGVTVSAAGWSVSRAVVGGETPSKRLCGNRRRVSVTGEHHMRHPPGWIAPRPGE